MKIINKKKTFALFLALIFVFLLFRPAFAIDLRSGLDNFLAITELPTTPLPIVIANVIRVFLGFLGLIATVIIIIAGFKWMSSGGNPEKISKAKKMMIAGLVGLVIIVLAYSIVAFVIKFLKEATAPGEAGGAGGEAGGGIGYQPPGARFLVITNKYPKAGETVARNIKISVSFNQGLREESIRLSRPNCPSPTIYIQKGDEYIDGSIIVRGNSFIFVPRSSCPPPLDSLACTISREENCNIEFSDRGCCGCFEPGDYTILLKGGQDGILGTRRGGNTLAQDISWNFTVEDFIEDQSPEIENALPSDSSTVSMNAGIIVSFTQPLDLSTLTVYNPNCVEGSPNCSYENCGREGCQSWAVDSLNDATVKITAEGNPIPGYFERLSARDFIFRPSGFCPEPASHCRCFPANSTIRVEISGDIRGAGCTNLDCSNGKCTWTFQTNDLVDLEGPRIESTFPANGATDIDRLTDISAIFNEPVDPTSINEDVFMVSDMLAREIRADRQQAIYNPYRILDKEKRYTATIYGGGETGGGCDLDPDYAFGVRDIYGNSMEEDFYRWSFETSSEVNQGDPYIDWIDPPVGPVGQCVTIHGYNLGSAQGRVEFCSEAEGEHCTSYLQGIVLLWQETEGENTIVAQVPQGAINISDTIPGQIKVIPSE